MQLYGLLHDDYNHLKFVHFYCYTAHHLADVLIQITHEESP